MDTGAQHRNLTNAIERDLMDRHGPLIADEALRAALGYSSMGAFRQALSRGRLPIPVFSMPQRRGKFALVKDVAAWLVEQRGRAAATSQEANVKK